MLIQQYRIKTRAKRTGAAASIVQMRASRSDTRAASQACEHMHTRMSIWRKQSLTETSKHTGCHIASYAAVCYEDIGFDSSANAADADIQCTSVAVRIQ